MHRDDPAEQLDRDLDRLAGDTSRGVTPNGRASAELQAAIALRVLDAADPIADPRPEFLKRMEDHLEMNAPGIAYRTRTSARGPVHRNSERQTVPQATGGWFPAAGAAKWLATAGLLALVALFAALSFQGRHRSDDLPTSIPGFAAASPTASPAPGGPCTGDAYVGCPGVTTLLGISTAELERDVEATALDVRQAQLQDWTVPPGSTVLGVSPPADTIRGVVVDFVLSGAYSATFDVPVTVVRYDTPLQQRWEYPQAGVTIELGPGDSVAYQLGGLVDLRNPLSQRPLHLKRAVFYEGDIAATHITATGVTMTVDGDGTLPQALGSYPLGSRGISLWYVQVPPGATFPPRQWRTRAIIGPVHPEEPAPVAPDGYVLTVGNPTG